MNEATQTAAAQAPAKTEQFLPIADALKLIKSLKGRKFFFGAVAHMPAKDDPEGRYFAYPVNIVMSREALVEKLADLYSGRFEREALVRIDDKGRCVFVG